MYAVTRSLIRSHALRQGIQRMQVTPAREIKMKVVPAASVTRIESYDDKNARLGREMSPHLSIYKPQLTSMMSITHRATGSVLSVYAWVLGLGALFSSHDAAHYVTMVEGLHLSSATLTAVKFVLAFPLAYHTCAGMRHLIWDSGTFLKISEVYMTGYVTLALTIALSVGLALL